MEECIVKMITYRVDNPTYCTLTLELVNPLETNEPLNKEEIEPTETSERRIDERTQQRSNKPTLKTEIQGSYFLEITQLCSELPCRFYDS